MPDQASSFTCPNCDRQYRFKPELEGKHVRCKCGEKFEVKPAQARAAQAKPATAKPAVAKPVAARPASRPVPRPAAKPAAAAPAKKEDNSAFTDLLASIDREAAGQRSAPAVIASASAAPAAAPAGVCPSCYQPVSPTAVICVACGANLRDGKKLKTKTGSVAAAAVPTSGGGGVSGGVGVKVAGVGLLLHFLGYIAILAAMGMVVAMLVSRGMGEGGLAGREMGEGAGMGFAAAGIGMLLLLIGGFVIVTLGPFLCLAAPSEAGRGKVATALGLYIASPIVSAVGGSVLGQAIHPIAGAIAAIAGSLLSLIGMAFLLMFYAQLAAYLNHPSLEASAERLQGIYKFILGAILLGIFVSWIPIIGQIVSLVMLGALVLFMLVYLWVTGRMAIACLRS